MLRDDLTRYAGELGGALEALPVAVLVRVADWLLDCYRRGGTVFILGNGGSAATASHFACDLAKGARAPGLPPFRVVPLTDNVPLLTAWANDTSYERVFAEQLAPLARPGDVAILISASGNSPNVLAAAEAARECGAATIALTGRPGGRLAARADLSVRVGGCSIEQVEDLHLVVAHSLCVALRARLRAEAELLHGPQKGADLFDAPSIAATAAS
jgi:D-sedoheptulose 7-phosphate isomerase